MNFIVVLEPSRQQSDYGLSIRQDRQPSIIAFEGIDECLRDAVGFWRADCLFQFENVFWSQSANNQVKHAYHVALQAAATIDIALWPDAPDDVGSNVSRSQL